MRHPGNCKRKLYFFFLLAKHTQSFYSNNEKGHFQKLAVLICCSKKNKETNGSFKTFLELNLVYQMHKMLSSFSSYTHTNIVTEGKLKIQKPSPHSGLLFVLRWPVIVFTLVPTDFAALHLKHLLLAWGLIYICQPASLHPACLEGLVPELVE